MYVFNVMIVVSSDYIIVVSVVVGVREELVVDHFVSAILNDQEAKDYSDSPTR